WRTTHATRFAARSWRPWCTATARSSSPRSTTRCSDCARGRRPSCASPDLDRSRVSPFRSFREAGTDMSQAWGYGRCMDEAARVLARLTRIEELRMARARGVDLDPRLLDELRALVPEAEAWARAEGDARARSAATKLREEAEGMD